MAVVPADELGGRVDATQVFAVDAHRPVRLVATGVDDAVIVAHEVVDAEVAPEHHVAEEAEALVGRGLVVDADHVLDLLVVGCDSATHESKRRRQPIEQVGRADDLVLEESTDRIKAARAGSDDGDAQGSLLTA